MSVINGNQRKPMETIHNCSHLRSIKGANMHFSIMTFMLMILHMSYSVYGRELRATSVAPTLIGNPLSTSSMSSAAISTTSSSVVGENKNDEFVEQTYCEVILNDAEDFKTIGSIWVSPQDPCSLHICELDKQGKPVEVIKKDNCGDFYCDVDSEVKPKNGSCCGECVRTKCRFGNEVYEIGKTWHNHEDCTILECGQLPNGLPIVNAYQKSCPELPKDCPTDQIFMENCCQYCKLSRTLMESAISSKSKDIWTEEFYKNHTCVRECQSGEPPRTCHYTFVVEWYETLSKACYDCPKNLSDCRRPHCIAGDGIARSVTVVNRMMPGPSIEVCQNDIVVVDVQNHLLGESTTMHWHGMHMKESPYMDGVPHITQCPISPHSTFRYTFKAENSGTHFWHSHTGMQRGDGVFGALIVKRPRSEDPYGHLYDFDLSDHKMILQDWVHVPGISMFASHHHSKGDNKPLNLLLNGKGRYYKAIWETFKAKATPRARSASEKPVTTESPKVTEKPSPITFTEIPMETEDDITTYKILDDDVVMLHPSNDPKVHGLRIQQNEISRSARLAPQRNETITNGTQMPENPSTESPGAEMSDKQRSKRSLDPDVPLEFIPLHQYNVTQGYRYRFRVINAEFLNCPIKISIDNHTLRAINSDGYDFEAVDVGSIITYAGERFDFILNANQPVGNYWIRLKGLMDCDERFTSAFQVGILHYDNANSDEPQQELGYHHEPEGIELNSMNKGSGYVDSLNMAELNALPVYDRVPGIDRDALKPVADYKFFVYYDFYRKDNPDFHPSEYYGMDANITNENLVFTPQLNHITLKFPHVALLPARDSLDESTFCNDTSLAQQGIDCRVEFCKCHHVLQVPLNSIVEFIIVDEGFTYDANHPFHLHGNAFRVVGMERLGKNVSIEMIKQLDRYNLLKRNLVRPPVKDTVTVPDGGYTIIRFEAHNPGFWLFHCHIEFHAEIGMALVLKVGNNDEMPPVPKNFPSCHDYMPQDDTDDPVEEPDEPNNNNPNPPNIGGNGSSSKIMPKFIVICFVSYLIMAVK